MLLKRIKKCKWLVLLLASINPIVEHINCLREIVYMCLKKFLAHGTGNSSYFFRLISMNTMKLAE